MVMKTLIVLLLMAVIASLLSGLLFLLRDVKGGQRTVRALTVRIALSLVLFIILMIGYQTGFLGSR